MTQRRAPTRTCVSCRTERDKNDLVRLVRRADGTVRVDPTGKASGRGAYLCADPACWAAALTSKSVQRGLDVSSSREIEALLVAGPPPGVGRPDALEPRAATRTDPKPGDSTAEMTHGA